MAEILKLNPEISLTNASKRAAAAISTSFDQIYSSRTIFTHYKRLVENSEFYSGKIPIFPASLGNNQSLSPFQIETLVKKIEERIAQKDMLYPNINNFISITYSLTGTKFSQSWMSRFLKAHKFKYGPPMKGKVGTRYHDSEINLIDRVNFLMRKIWFIAFEKCNKASIFVHDESWINERPSGSNVWSSENVKPGKKNEGFRFAFSSLWCISRGLLHGCNDFDSLLPKIINFKATIDSNPLCTLEDLLQHIRDSELPLPDPLAISSRDEFIIPDHLQSPLFLFPVKTAAANKGRARQMDSEKFIWSVEKMIRHVLQTHDKTKKIVIQLDNATYHRKPADSTLRNIVNPYPSKSQSGKSTTSMLEQLQKWNRLPEGEANDWFQPIKNHYGRLSKHKTPAQRKQILHVQSKISEHKRWIKRFFRMCPEYRQQKTLVEEMIEKLSIEYSKDLDFPIEVLWGPRGHSELAEIEHSWNFMKNWVKKMNPRRPKDTRYLLLFSQVLESTYSHSWRNRVILCFDCYFENGYFTSSLLREKYKNKATILQKWNDLFDHISSSFLFTAQGFERFVEFIRPKITKQLSYTEIQSFL